MAITYFKGHHISKGETIAQSMKDLLIMGKPVGQRMVRTNEAHIDN